MQVRELSERLDSIRYRCDRDPKRMREEADQLLAEFLDDMDPAAADAFRKVSAEAEHAA